MPNEKDSAPSPIYIAIVVFDGFDELDAIAPFEVLARLAGKVSGVETTLVAAGAPSVIVSAHGMRIHVEHPLPTKADFVIVPGGGWTSGADVGVRAEVK